jgi:hypothetical protein
MRKTALAMLLTGILTPAAALAQMDGGVPDGSYVTPTAADDSASAYAGHTGTSSDPNGNMGNTGRTGKDAGATNQGGQSGQSGQSGSDEKSPPRRGPAPEDQGTPSPYPGKSNPPP